MKRTRRFIKIDPTSKRVLSDSVSEADEQAWDKLDAETPTLPAGTYEIAVEANNGTPISRHTYDPGTGRFTPVVPQVVTGETTNEKLDRLIVAVEALTTAVNNGKP